MNKKNRKNKGFSLVELIIVIAIMAILAGIFAAQFMRHLRNSRISGDLEAADRIAKQIEAQVALDAVTGDETAGCALGTEDASCSGISETVLNGANEDDITSKVESVVFTYSIDDDGDVTITAGDKEVYPNADEAFELN